MRMTNRKKEILSYFEPDNLEWVSPEVGSPPLDVSGVAYLLHGMDGFKKSVNESVRRTLEGMVLEGMLERVNVYERRENRTGGEVRCMVSRYGLPGCNVVQIDRDGSEGSIAGECSEIRSEIDKKGDLSRLLN